MGVIKDPERIKQLEADLESRRQLQLEQRRLAASGPLDRHAAAEAPPPPPASMETIEGLIGEGQRLSGVDPLNRYDAALDPTHKPPDEARPTTWYGRGEFGPREDSDFDSLMMRFLSSAGHQLSLEGLTDPSMRHNLAHVHAGPPEGLVEKAVEAGGGILGMVPHLVGPGGFARTAGRGAAVSWAKRLVPEAMYDAYKLGNISAEALVAKAIANKGVPRFANAAAKAVVEGGLPFGLFEGLKPAGSAEEWADRVAHGVTIGTLFHGLPKVPGLRRISENYGGRMAVDFTAMYGLARADGGSHEDALASALGIVLGSRAIPGQDPIFGRTGRPKGSVDAAVDAVKDVPLHEIVLKYKRGMAEQGINRVDPATLRADPLRDAAMRRYNEARTEGPPLLEAGDPAPGGGLPVAVPESPRATIALPDLRPDPYRDAAMRKYNEARLTNAPADQRRPAINEGELRTEMFGESGGRPGGPARRTADDLAMDAMSGDIFGTKPRSLQDRVVARRQARDVNLNMLGGQDLYEATVGALKMSRGIRDKFKNSFDRLFQEIDTMPESAFLAAYGQGRITSEQMLAGLRGLHAKGRLTGGFKDGAHTVNPAVAKQVKAGETGRVSPSGAAEFTDKRRTTQAVGGGKLNSPIVKANQRIGEMAELVEMKMADEFNAELADAWAKYGITPKDKVESRALGSLLYKMRDAGSRDPQKYLNDKVLDGVGDRQSIVDAAGATIEIGNRHWALRNEVSELYTGKGVGRTEGAYISRVPRKKSMVREPWGWLKQVTEPRQPVADQGAGKYPVRARSVYERRSTGKTEDLETNVWKVFDLYASDTASRITNQIPLATAKSTADFMRQWATELRKLSKDDMDQKKADEIREEAKGLELSAKALEQVFQSSYNDIPFGFRKAMQDAMLSTRPGVAAYKLAALNKQVFNRVRYTFNVPFMVLRQWSSIGLLGSMPAVQPKDMAAAAFDMFQPWTKDLYYSTYVGQAKSRGHIVGEGANRPLSAGRRLSGEGKLQKIDRLAAKPTNMIEELTGRFAISVGTKIADRLGLEGRMRNDFLSDMMSKTQSEYHSTSRAEILKDPFANFAFPAQSFNLEFMNNIREAVSENVGVNWYTSKQAKTYAVARAFVGMAVASLAYEYVNNFEDLDSAEGQARFMGKLGLNVGTAAVPYSSILTGLGPGEGKPYTAASAQKWWQAFEHAVGGESDRAMNDLAGLIVPGGGQLSRAMATDRMIKRGILGEDERIKGSLFGWWTTEPGRAYMRQIKGRKSSGGDPETGRQVRTRPPRPQRAPREPRQRQR
jgi:hypothetical protein